MKWNRSELDCQFVLAAKPRPVDRESHESLVALAGVAASTYPFRRLSVLSLTHGSKQQPLSAPLITPADGVTG